MATATITSSSPWRTIGKRLYTGFDPNSPNETTLLPVPGSDDGAGGWLGRAAPKILAHDGVNEIDTGVKYVYWALYATFDIRSAVPPGSRINSVQLRYNQEFSWEGTQGLTVPYLVTMTPPNAVAATGTWWPYAPVAVIDPFGLFPNGYRNLYTRGSLWWTITFDTTYFPAERLPSTWAHGPFFVCLLPVSSIGISGWGDNYVKLNQNHEVSPTDPRRPQLIIDYDSPATTAPNNTITHPQLDSKMVISPSYSVNTPPVIVNQSITSTLQSTLTVSYTTTSSFVGSLVATLDSLMATSYSTAVQPAISSTWYLDSHMAVDWAYSFGVQHPFPVAASLTCFQFVLDGEEYHTVSGDTYVGVDSQPLTLGIILGIAGRGDVGVTQSGLELSASAGDEYTAALFARFESSVTVGGW